jgi:hypothetical protein
MYRMYAPAAGGFVIGFPRELLKKLGAVIDVEYSNHALWAWARAYAQEYIEMASSLTNPTKTAEQINIEVLSSTDLLDRRILAGLTYKSSEFSNEAEVRLVLMGGATHYRESREGNYIIPYRTIDLPNAPIEVPITYGPNKDPYLANQATAQIAQAGVLAGTKWQFGQLSSGEYGFRT